MEIKAILLYYHEEEVVKNSYTKEIEINGNVIFLNIHVHLIIFFHLVRFELHFPNRKGKVKQNGKILCLKYL